MHITLFEMVRIDRTRGTDNRKLLCLDGKGMGGYLQRDSALKDSLEWTEEQEGGSSSKQNVFICKQEWHDSFVLPEPYQHHLVFEQRKKPSVTCSI